MAEQESRRAGASPRPAIGLVAGIAAGLAVSATLAALQKRAARPRRESAADKALTVPEPDPVSGLTHYLMGGMLGGVYGVLAEYRPNAPAGFGTALGLASAALSDKLAVRTRKARGDAPHAPVAPSYNQALFLMYGITLDGFRALLTRKRRGS